MNNRDIMRKFKIIIAYGIFCLLCLMLFYRGFSLYVIIWFALGSFFCLLKNFRYRKLAIAIYLFFTLLFIYVVTIEVKNM